MAKSINDEELQLRKRARRRLVGAIALVALVVVLLPMMLDDEYKALDEDISIRIPSPNADGFAPKAVIPPPAGMQPHPIAPPAVSAPLPASAISPAPASAAAPASAPAAKETPHVAPAEKADKADKAEKEKADNVAKQVYMVQIGTFANPDNAKQAHKKIVAAGIKAYDEVIKMPQGNKTRVRAGPFATHEAAVKAQAKLKEIGLDGQIAAKPVK